MAQPPNRSVKKVHFKETFQIISNRPRPYGSKAIDQSSISHVDQMISHHHETPRETVSGHLQSSQNPSGANAAYALDLTTVGGRITPMRRGIIKTSSNTASMALQEFSKKEGAVFLTAGYGRDNQGKGFDVKLVEVA
ncbi:hypothetical protein BS50DRAFT_593123 [Corynespora cassiicola Philippines]|uniref:Uncharacterized protein n=1 Tax=Corynespora cassiicola Philippines TaxID=1448308 RepID=A0A2T2N6X1_CORCC|nr:hypothetical protein BS50DRAFT_593123 [Corynespora cassiicola Philippines]